MSERARHDFSNLDIDLARRLDAVCRRFEADRREGRHAPFDDYLRDVPEEGHAALRAELQALEREPHPPPPTEAEPDTAASAPENCPRPSPKHPRLPRDR